MLKQYIAIILLCISNFLLVGHSIVPHHHAHAETSKMHLHAKHEDHHHHHSVNHHEHHNDDHDEQGSGLGDLFAFVNHAKDYVRNENELPKFEQSVQQEVLDIAIVSCTKTIFVSETSLQAKQLLYRDPDYYPPPNSHKGLRAPPVFFS